MQNSISLPLNRIGRSQVVAAIVGYFLPGYIGIIIGYFSYGLIIEPLIISLTGILVGLILIAIDLPAIRRNYFLLESHRALSDKFPDLARRYPSFDRIIEQNHRLLNIKESLIVYECCFINLSLIFLILGVNNILTSQIWFNIPLISIIMPLLLSLLFFIGANQKYHQEIRLMIDALVHYRDKESNAQSLWSLDKLWFQLEDQAITAANRITNLDKLKTNTPKEILDSTRKKLVEDYLEKLKKLLEVEIDFRIRLKDVYDVLNLSIVHKLKMMVEEGKAEVDSGLKDIINDFDSINKKVLAISEGEEMKLTNLIVSDLGDAVEAAAHYMNRKDTDLITARNLIGMPEWEVQRAREHAQKMREAHRL
jgi:hypothetical protein